MHLQTLPSHLGNHFREPTLGRDGIWRDPALHIQDWPALDGMRQWLPSTALLSPRPDLDTCTLPSNSHRALSRRQTLPPPGAIYPAGPEYGRVRIVLPCYSD